MRRIVAFLLLLSLTLGLSETADAQFWKKKSKRHAHKSKSKKADKEKVAAKTAEEETDTPEEDDRLEVKEPKKTKAQKKKDKQEKKRKEKEERKKQKEKEKKEKREKKDKKKHKGKDTVIAPVEEPVKVVKKWADIEYPASKKKSHYRIDILAPMYLDELVKNGYPTKDIPDKAVKGLDFYKGVQMAADTLKKALFDIDIYVHDVASILESSEMLIRKNALDSSDLLIGAVADKDVPSLAAFAKRKQINFISAVSPSDGGVRDNQYFTLLQPSLKSYCEWVAAKVETTFPKGKVLLMHRTSNPLDDNAYSYLTDDPNKRGLFFTLLCNTVPSKDAINLLIDSGRSNIVVVAIHDVKYADSLLKTLKKDFPATHFEVYGMPSWGAAGTGSIYKSGLFPDFTFNIPTAFGFGNPSPMTKYIDQVFKKDYGGKPTDMVYRGFETMYWYANMLRNYGIIFNKYYSDNEAAPINKFEVKPQWDSKGNVIYQENRHLSLERVEGVRPGGSK